jgi:hypothetical protein
MGLIVMVGRGDPGGGAGSGLIVRRSIVDYVIVDDSRRGDQPPNVMDPETYGEVSRCATYE